MTHGIRLNYDAVAPGHVKVTHLGQRYLVVLSETGAHRVVVICKRNQPMPMQADEWTRTIKPQSQNWKAAVKLAQGEVA